MDTSELPAVQSPGEVDIQFCMHNPDNFRLLRKNDAETLLRSTAPGLFWEPWLSRVFRERVEVVGCIGRRRGQGPGQRKPAARVISRAPTWSSAALKRWHAGNQASRGPGLTLTVGAASLTLAAQQRRAPRGPAAAPAPPSSGIADDPGRVLQRSCWLACRVLSCGCRLLEIMVLGEVWTALSGLSGVCLACSLLSAAVVLRWTRHQAARGAVTRARQKQRAGLETMDKAVQRFRLQVKAGAGPGVGWRGEHGVGKAAPSTARTPEGRLASNADVSPGTEPPSSS